MFVCDVGAPILTVRRGRVSLRLLRADEHREGRIWHMEALEVEVCRNVSDDTLATRKRLKNSGSFIL